MPCLQASVGGDVWYLEFEGTFHFTQIWINDVHVLDHELGYTPYALRLDNLTGILKPSATNVIALRCDASYGSGHWYEGGGAYWGKVNHVRGKVNQKVNRRKSR